MKKYGILAVIMMLSFGMIGCQKAKATDEIAQGTAAIQKQSYEEALSYFEKAAASDENLIQAYRGKGMAYMGLGQYDQAIDAFNEALNQTEPRMKDTKKDILFYKASAVFHQEKYEETVEVCNEILNIEPDANAFFIRGNCFLMQGQEDQAQVDFKSAIKQNPQDYDLYLNIYESYKQVKQSAKGDEYLQMALQIENHEDTYDKGRIYYYLEDYEEAENQLESLVEKKDPKAILLMGKVYLALENEKKAEEMYHLYLEDNEPAPDVYNGLTLVNIQKKNYGDALKNIEAGLALEAETGKQSLYFNEIVVYEYMGNFAAAKEKAFAYTLKYPADEQGKKEYDFLTNP